jgi:hypothetical protein
MPASARFAGPEGVSVRSGRRDEQFLEQAIDTMLNVKVQIESLALSRSRRMAFHHSANGDREKDQKPAGWQEAGMGVCAGQGDHRQDDMEYVDLS